MIENPSIAIIGGSGLSSLTAMQVYDSEWPGTPYGEPNAPLQHTRLGGEMVIFFARHGEGGAFAPHRVNYRANLTALKQAGIKKVIAVNVVGGITEEMKTGTICIPDQLIDYTFGRADTFFDGSNNKPIKHIDFAQPFNADVCQQLLAAAQTLELPVVEGGVYGCTQGPRLETAAEINRMERDGCDVVGMTAMPEAVLAMELGLEYASVCVVVNRASGRSDKPLSLSEIRMQLAETMPKVEKLLRVAVQGLTTSSDATDSD
jgi:5'-methylthioinosine phosphorylase